MTIEQITAINNAMSMLVDVDQLAQTTSSVEGFVEYTSEHIKALKDAGVSEHIVEHCQHLVNTFLELARRSEIESRRWEDFDANIVY
jgi:inorganic pyrophosphatase